MNQDLTPPEPKPERERPTTAGMTTKVVKGSLWTLAGQVAPLAVSLFTTPFVIRMLGAEGYGVLVLIALIPTYFSFADFGMGIASTKFGSEAYAEGDPEKEASVVNTAALIALISSTPFAAGMMIFAEQIISLFNVPQNLHWEAVTSLRIAAVTFVLTLLSQIYNTPQLSRLKMNVNSSINAIFRIAGLLLSPIIVFLGYGIVGIATTLLLLAIGNLAAHFIVSLKYLTNLRSFDIFKRENRRPMVGFGIGIAEIALVAFLLLNVEKLIVSHLISVTALAYYSVAYTFVTISSMPAVAINQTLMPAFSQLLNKGDNEEFKDLFVRMIRFNTIFFLPILAGMFVIARPVFTIWAGPDFGENSSWVFYLLSIGLFFNLNANVPYCALAASGRTDLLTRVYRFQFLFYAALVYILVSSFGFYGAALSWSLRILADAIILIFLVFKHLNLRAEALLKFRSLFLIALCFLPLLVSVLLVFPIPAQILIFIISFGIYAAFLYKWELYPDEIFQVRNKIGSYVKFISER